MATREQDNLQTRPQRHDRTQHAQAWPLDDLATRLGSLNFLKALFYGYLVVMILILTFIIPPFQKSDEVAHYLRAVSITNLDLTCSQAEDGTQYFAMKRKYTDLPIIARTFDVAMQGNMRYDFAWLRHDFSDPVLQEEGIFTGYCTLSPTGYIPSAVGVLAGKPFENPLFSFYLGRIAGVLFFVAAIVYALRLTPERYRLMIYLYAGLPIVIHQFSTIGYDVVQLSLFPVIFAYLTKFNEENRPIPLRDFAIFVLLIVWAISVRLTPYTSLVLLLFAIKPALIATEMKRYVALAGGAALAVTAAIFAISRPYLGQVEEDPNNNIDSYEQLDFVLAHPWDFIEASYRTLVQQGDWLTKQGVGIFGWIDAPMGFLPYYLIVFVAGAILYRTFEADRPVMSGWQIAAVLAMVAGSIVSLFVSLYAIWTPVGGDEVLGLQGRYFIGLLPFLALGLSQLSQLIGRRQSLNLMALTVVVIIIFNTYRTVDLRYFI